MSAQDSRLHRLSSRVNGPNTPLRILSLGRSKSYPSQDQSTNSSPDGGGVRGLSSLILLQHIFGGIKGQLKRPNMLPCEYFDLIGGTSTGGIIAIMLGRLRMRIEECIQAYEKIGEAVFKHPRWAVGFHSAKFSHEPLEQLLKTTIAKYLSRQPRYQTCAEEQLENVALFDPEVQPGRGCCTVVYALNPRNLNEPRVFRSYHSSENPADETIKIWEAARATSAAPGTFEALKIGTGRHEVRYIDGGLGKNNPCDVLLTEAGNIWYDLYGNEDMKRYEDIGLLLSIGTGMKHVTRLDEDSLAHRLGAHFQKPVGYIQVMRDMITNSETFHKSIQEQRLPSYFRFNVHHGLEDVALFEYKASREIEADTLAYLADMETRTLKRRVWDRALSIAGLPPRSPRTFLDAAPVVGKRHSSANLDAGVRPRGNTLPIQQRSVTPTIVPARMSSTRTVPTPQSQWPVRPPSTFTANTATAPVFNPVVSEPPASPSLASRLSTSSPLVSATIFPSRLPSAHLGVLPDRGNVWSIRTGSVVSTPNEPQPYSPQEYQANAPPAIHKDPQIPIARSGSIFSELTNSPEHLRAPLTSDMYWSRMTPLGFHLYEKIYNELPKTGSGHVSLQGLMHHFSPFPNSQSQIPTHWRLLLLPDRALAPRAYIIILLYMLHLSRFFALRPQSKSVSAPISAGRFTLIQRAGNWVPCQCQDRCGTLWTFPGNGALGVYRYPGERGCRAVRYYERVGNGGGRKSDAEFEVFVRMESVWLASEAHFQIPM